MAANGDTNRISLADANVRGISELVREAEEGREQIIVRNDKPIAVVIGAERYERLLGLQDDLIDITLVAARVITDNGERFTLDEVLERFGYTREELADEPAPQSDDPRSKTSASAQSGFRSVDPATHPLLGRWRIVEMDPWDRDYLDMAEPAYIAFDTRGRGEFVFGLVNGCFDCGYSPSSIEFIWGGNDEMEEAFGDGWAEIQDDGTVTGEIRFHSGDESGFKAHRW